MLILLLTFPSLGWLELFRLPHCGFILSGTISGRRQRPLYASLIPFAKGIQVSKIMEISQRHFNYYGKHYRCIIKLDLRTLHYHLHIRRYGHATVRLQLL